MTKNYRKIYEKHFGPIPKDDQGRSYHIHHRDGNHNNNNPENLQAVSLEEHYKVHLEAGDWWAALRLAQRLRMTQEEISTLAKKRNTQAVEAGTHPFLNKNNASKGGKRGIEHVKRNGWSKEAIRKRVETRRKNGSFNNQMKEANSPESIKKRVATIRQNNGYEKSISASHKSRIRNSLIRMCNHFIQPFSYELLEIARRKKVTRIPPQNVRKHFSKEELEGLWSPPQVSDTDVQRHTDHHNEHTTPQ